MYTPTRPLGLFGCEVDRSRYPTARIHPGRQNMWVVGKRAGAPGIVNDIVGKWLKPVDTSSWFTPSNALFAVVQEDANGTRFYVTQSQRTILQNATEFDDPPILGTGRQFYVVLFNAPQDAPSEIPWPVEGCPEEANWALLWTTSSQPIQTEVSPPSQVSEGQATMEARRKAAEDALLEASKFGEEEKGVSKLWLFAGLTVVAGAGLFALRRARGTARRPVPSR